MNEIPCECPCQCSPNQVAMPFADARFSAALSLLSEHGRLEYFGMIAFNEEFK